jgi:hypothetical protein
VRHALDRVKAAPPRPGQRWPRGAEVEQAEELDGRDVGAEGAGPHVERAPVDHLGHERDQGHRGQGDAPDHGRARRHRSADGGERAGGASEGQPYRPRAGGVDGVDPARREPLEPPPRHQPGDDGHPPYPGLGVEPVGGPEQGGDEEHHVHPVDEDQVGAAEGVRHPGQDGRPHGRPQAPQQEVGEGLGEQQGQEDPEPHGVPGGEHEEPDAEGRQKRTQGERPCRLAGGRLGVPALERPPSQGPEEGDPGRQRLRLVALGERLDMRHPAQRVAVGRLGLHQVDSGVRPLAEQGLGHEQEGADGEDRCGEHGPPEGVAGHVGADSCPSPPPVASRSGRVSLPRCFRACGRPWRGGRWFSSSSATC